MRPNIRVLGITALAAIAAVALIACGTTNDPSTDGTGTSAASTVQGTSVDRDALLNDLTEVQAMVTAASSEFIADVSYDGSTLTVTVTQDASEIQQAEQVCSDVSASVQAADVAIKVVNEAGDELASCQFKG